MVQIHIDYKNNLRCAATHGPSDAQLLTDAPIDNHGKGESFSPTDLLATGLGTCMMTILGIVAQKRKIDLSGAKVDVLKEMTPSLPRRIQKLTVNIHLPLAEDDPSVAILSKAAMECPVLLSLHPEVEKDVAWHFAKQS